MKFSDDQFRRADPERWDSEEWQDIRGRFLSNRYDEHAAECAVTYGEYYEGNISEGPFISLRVVLKDGRSGSCLRSLVQPLDLTPGEVDRWFEIALEQAERDRKTEARENFEADLFDQLDKGDVSTVTVPRNAFRDRYECEDQDGVRATAREVAERWGLVVSVTAESVRFQLIAT